MSKLRKDYEKSPLWKFLTFVKGDTPLPEEDHTEEWIRNVERAEETEKTENANYIELKETDPYEDAKRFAQMSGVRVFRKIYYVLAALMCIMIIAMLIMNVAFMPRFGSDETPTNNEVAERYLADGVEETGAVNLVTGMILKYRAFDTFGETNVLFIAACSVMILLLHRESTKLSVAEGRGKKLVKKKKREDEEDVDAEQDEDVILQTIARIVVPLIFLFGLYILLNGHLSPGGGFSGGAVMGAGLILYNSAFGFRKTQRFFDETVYDVIKVGSLCLYALIIAYYLFTGANGIDPMIPLGTPGKILSSGLILPINLLVGLEVACTMYAFYALFRRGSF
ncbi:MAG: hypothetical protein IJM57_01730 [Lachnospiraceae bacterium]|nr:hypothetical protein [Lachnospiraceae bacterium]